MQRLYVYYEKFLVGKLHYDEELVYSFTYDASWLKNPKKFPLSLALPLSAEPFGNRLTLSFFENLLPEGEVRESIKRQQHLESTFDFLEKFGQDSAGAIVITPQEDYDADIQHGARNEVDITKIYAAIEQHQPVAQALAEMKHQYLSLAGAQDKFPVIHENRKFYIPTHSAPTTHVVKIPIWRFGVKESVFNEYYCMELARQVGMEIPPCDIIPGKHPLFIIQRYDRYKDKAGTVHRIHQQDFCQAQGITSEKKYEDKGGPSIKQNYDFIVQNTPSKSRLKNINQFIDWICFNLIIGNNDSHSKNISFLLQESGNELSPMYDLICTAIYPKLKRDFSFRIGDRTEFSKIGKNQIEMMESELNLKTSTFQKRLQTMSEKIIDHKDIVASDMKLKYPQVKIMARISALIEKRVRSLRKQGGLL